MNNIALETALSSGRLIRGSTVPLELFLQLREEFVASRLNQHSHIKDLALDAIYGRPI